RGLRLPEGPPPLAPARPGAAARLPTRRRPPPAAAGPRGGASPRARGARAGPGGGRGGAGGPQGGRRGRAVGAGGGVYPGERFYLVDGPSYLYRAYHAIAHLSTSRGLPTNATLGMTMMLWKMLREERPTYMAVAWDAPGPTFRHQAFEAYKIQRPGMPKDL